VRLILKRHQSSAYRDGQKEEEESENNQYERFWKTHEGQLTPNSQDDI
jgi:hypothetical protein